MKIILVDDNLRHRRAGKKQLEAMGHEVCAFSEYGEARAAAAKQPFDAALLDLLMPAETTMLGSKARVEHVGKEIGVGFPLALAMAMSGIRKVAVATDTNHHHHPHSAIMEWFHSDEPLTVNDATILFMHAPMNGEGVKDWGQILERLLAA